jgi:hypothetical protein
MKEFIKKHSYDMMKMFLNQFAVAIFGLVLALATGMAENDTLQIVSSVGAILFYMFLLYAMTFEIGGKDKTAVEYGRIKARPLTGLYISLCANAINYLLAILITLGTVSSNAFLSNVGAVAATAALLLEGMYTGLLAINVGDIPLNAMIWPFFVITVPALLASTAGYYFGMKGWHLTKILIPKNAEEIEQAQEKKKK